MHPVVWTLTRRLKVLTRIILIALVLAPLSFAQAAERPFNCFSIPQTRDEYQQDSKTKQWCLPAYRGWTCRAVTGFWGSYKVASCHTPHTDKRVAYKAVMGQCKSQRMSCSDSDVECKQVGRDRICYDYNPDSPENREAEEEARRRVNEELDRQRDHERYRKFREWCRQNPDQCRDL